MATTPGPEAKSDLPRLASYLAALPQGIDSHPECRIKGFYFRESVQALKDAAALAKAWPAPLQKWFASPPPNSGFMPEVHFCAFRLCVADQLGMTQQGFEEWVHGGTRSIYKGFLGKVIMAFASKKVLLSAAGSRWAMIHQGSSFKAVRVEGTDTYRGTLTFPPHLYDEVLLRGLGGLMRAAFELVEKDEFVLNLVSFSDTTAVYETVSPDK